jgi:mannonate dehydratase
MHPPVWELRPLVEMKERFGAAGLELQVIESAPHSLTEPIRLGLPESDRALDRFCELLGNMARAEIGVICPHWMPIIGPVRTPGIVYERGGAVTTGYQHESDVDAGLTSYGRIPASRLWENAARFLEQVVPVAESVGVKLAIHPDDPPVPSIRGVDRILSTLEGLQRWLEIADSPNSGLAFCQGTIASMGVDVPDAVRRFGSAGRIHFVHFRDIKGVPESFVETFHDNGQTDMVDALRAYREVGVRAPIRVDHVPTMAGESTDLPGYATLGRLFALGYLRGIVESLDSTDRQNLEETT